jgi:hypothetical protein
MTLKFDLDYRVRKLCVRAVDKASKIDGGGDGP